MPESYGEALALLGEFSKSLFPLEHYRENVIRAFILAAQGRQAEARPCAHLALQAAAATHSGMRYHAKVGLVTSPDPKIIKRLQLLAD